MQRLGTAKRSAECFNGSTHHVVVRVLLGQAPAGRLAVGTQSERFRVGRAKAADRFTPQIARRAQHGDVHKQIHADTEEERQARGEVINFQSGGECSFDVFNTVCQRKRYLLHAVRSGFTHVIAADADGVKAWHVARAPGDDVGDNAHGRFWGINVGVAAQVLFQNIVLNGPGELFRRYALFFCSDDIKRQHRQNRAVHGHRY